MKLALAVLSIVLMTESASAGICRGVMESLFPFLKKGDVVQSTEESAASGGFFAYPGDNFEALQAALPTAKLSLPEFAKARRSLKSQLEKAQPIVAKDASLAALAQDLRSLEKNLEEQKDPEAEFWRLAYFTTLITTHAIKISDPVKFSQADISETTEADFEPTVALAAFRSVSLPPVLTRVFSARNRLSLLPLVGALGMQTFVDVLAVPVILVEINDDLSVADQKVMDPWRKFRHDLNHGLGDLMGRLAEKETEGGKWRANSFWLGHILMKLEREPDETLRRAVLVVLFHLVRESFMSMEAAYDTLFNRPQWAVREVIKKMELEEQMQRARRDGRDIRSYFHELGGVDSAGLDRLSRKLSKLLRKLVE